MLSVLKRIISRNKTDNKFAGPDSPDLSVNPRFVTEPEKILKVLESIVENPILCTIPSADSDEIYSTKIIEVIKDKQLITLKPLDSSQGNQALKQHKQLKLTAHFNHINISIALDQVIAHKIQHSAYFQAPFPSRIYYPQRRNHIRIDSSNFRLPFQGISDRTHATVGGTVENISRRGLAIIIDNSTARIRVGELLKNCTLTLDDHTKIHFDFTVRHQEPYSQNSLVTIGGSFEEISSMEEQISLDNFLSSLERTEIVAKNDI